MFLSKSAKTLTLNYVFSNYALFQNNWNECVHQFNVDTGKGGLTSTS